MVNQNVWIAITIVLFVSGIGVGFGIFSSSQVMLSPMMGGSMNSFTNNPQALEQMMQDPDFRNEIMEFMIQDTEHMNQWMLEDPQHNTMMIEEMKQNHDFMMGIAMPMIQDPGLRLQLLGHMTESPEAMAQMQQMMGGEMTGQTMMSSESMKEMMEDPETRNKMIELMSPHITEMQELLSSELSDEEFDTKMNEIMEKHHQALRVLMHDEPLGHDESMSHDVTQEELGGHDDSHD
ncbi:MAG: hypothetical protein IIA19_07960 [Thaumarchaeota archaeon]|nr:hypothetical protein [Nitrososphaerota archaeon]